MILFLLSVTGTALILTQSSIFEPLRIWLHAEVAVQRLAGDLAIIDGNGLASRIHRGKSSAFAVLSKLASCPMCAGFWIGLAWGTAMFDPTFGAAMFVYGPAGSFASAIGVALWLLLVEAHGVLGLWRYLNQPKE